MGKLKLIYDYRNIPRYRLSFYELAKKVFGINFEKWYERGGWNDRYICYSFVHENKMAANVSVSKMDIILEGEAKKALQIGTVMTHPEYRGKGLSAKLIYTVLEEYEKKSDFIYLFANESVVNFYPKFGFKHFAESRFSLDINIKKTESHNIRKLDISSDDDLRLIVNFSRERRPVSKILGVINDYHLLLFHCIYVFHNSIYYLEDEDLIAIFKEEEDKLFIYDLISKGDFSFEDILSDLSSGGRKKSNFLFYS